MIKQLCADMEIRFATPADAHAIAEVHVASWQTAYRELMDHDWLDRVDVQKRAERYVQVLGTADQRIGVAEQDGNIVGFTSYGPSRDTDADPNRTAEINAVYLLADCQRKGIGRALCRWTFDQLRWAGNEEATLWVLQANTSACRFYETIGFKPDGHSKQVEFDAPHTAIRYRSMIPAD